MAPKSLGPSGHQACTTSALPLKLCHVPLVEVISNLIREFAEQWHWANHAPKKDIAIAWGSVPITCHTEQPWKKVTNALDAVRAALVAIGWKPIMPNKWPL